MIGDGSVASYWLLLVGETVFRISSFHPNETEEWNQSWQELWSILSNTGSNLSPETNINGEALHSSVGLPPALNVATAKVGKLEIKLPSVSNVQIEPIIVQIDRLDLVFEENSDFKPSENPKTPTSSTPSGASAKGSGYGFADKIADGMTIQIHTVNLLLETHGSACLTGAATWAPPMASITMHNLLLCTTNESWQKLEWESLSIDLLPHPDMFTDATLGSSQVGSNLRDDDGAKRVFFGGERFIEGISGEAYITVQRTELNSPLGLEVQLHVTEVVCPALSEPGLRALLRFMTGVYVCLNRGNVDSQQQSTEAAGRSRVSIVVDHIFLRIKDSGQSEDLNLYSVMVVVVKLSWNLGHVPEKIQKLKSLEFRGLMRFTSCNVRSDSWI
ncbi:hypothetical protein KIW84_073564 [Lathyrus oleraceus]|uniref:Uncharacterized protein n=1 Tax=Pisum sativum TaxID=3888 RepID=A0A9D4VP06_PEA|nr:hypothetical protein KIW84_073564 [Pisum sativum]